jgi:nitrogen regulatory protein PII
MKSILITYDQAYHEGVLAILSKVNVRGYTGWTGITGVGTNTGMPHMGSHAWPSLNNAVLIVADDQKVEPVLAALRELDATSELLGLRAFVWNIEGGM